MFIFFFGIMCICALTIIWKSWQRYNTFSAGYYKNTGQDIIIWCNKSQNEIIRLLNNRSQNDTLKYDFYINNECCFFNVKGIRRLQTMTFFPVLFMLEFIKGEKGTYLVAKLAKRSQILYSTRFEVELYEFFERKIGGVPQKSIDC